MKTNTTFFFIFTFFVKSLAGGSVVIDSLRSADGELTLSYHIENILSAKGSQALQRGITSEVVHHIQLWQKKGFINPLEKEYIYSVKIFYDSWEKKYRILSEDENRLTSQIETVKEKCSVVKSLPIVMLADLQQNKKYFISISVTFQPISAESYNALSDIFSKGDKQQGGKKKRKPGYLGVLVNLLGFGDKEFSGKSQDFYITDTGLINFVK